MQLNLADTDAGRRLENGRVVVTLISKKTTDHITLRVRCKAKDKDGKPKRYVTLDEATIVTFDVPRYRDPEGNLSPGGDRTAWIHPRLGLQENKGADPARFWAAKALLSYLQTGVLHSQLELKVEHYCARCGRPISHQDSIDTGMGNECSGKGKDHYKHRHQRRGAPA